MAKAYALQPSFNAGEWSPQMYGRVDIDRYGVSCKKLENFVPLVEGPVTKRMGTKFVSEVKDSSDRTWLGRFVFNETQAFILEFGDQYIRFYTDNGVLLSGGSPYEIVSPWSAADLVNSDGAFALQMVQSADVVYIASGTKPVQKLTRISNTNWTIEDVDFTGGPFKDVDPDSAITVYASAQSGTGITITASAALFDADHVGCLFYIEQKSVDGIKQWEVGKSISTNDLRRSDGNVYKALNTATTGSVKPVHTSGAKYDGDTGVQWQYQHSGYGWAKITAHTSSTQVTADVLSLIPDQAVGSGNATNRWALQKWNGVDLYPAAISLFRERLGFGKDIDIDLSVAGGYEDMRAKDGDQIVSDQAISLTLSTNEISPIKWMTALSTDLLIGTANGEYTLTSQTDSSPFGPANKEARFQASRGSRAVRPVVIEDSVFYVQLSGQRLWQLQFSVDSNKYVPTDKMLYARHVAKSGIIGMAFQREPNSVLWCHTADGSLIAATLSVSQAVAGWHRHPVGGDGIVEAVETIPSPDGASDQLWMIVRRTINGATKRYVEYMVPEWDGDVDAIEDAFFVDCGLTYSGVAATTITGLGHIEGEEVAILADGGAHPPRTVTSGQITLQEPATKVHVGYGYTSKLTTNKMEAGAADGTAQGKTKRISRFMVRLLNTVNLKVGPNDSNMEELNFRSTDDLMDSSVPLFTGDYVVAWPGGHETEAIMQITHDQPLPVTVCAISARTNVQDS